MKTQTTFLITTACGTLLLAAVGCGKQESSTPATSTSAPAAQQVQKAATATADKAGQVAADVAKATDKAVADTKQAAGQAAADTKKATEQAVADVQKTATAGAAEATKLAESSIESIKKLVSEKKYQEALTALQQATAKLQLTPEQQKTVDDLLAQVQKALATDPTKVVGGLLEPKK